MSTLYVLGDVHIHVHRWHELRNAIYILIQNIQDIRVYMRGL